MARAILDEDATRKIKCIPRYKPLDPRLGLIRALEVASMYRPPGELGTKLEELLCDARNYAENAA